MGELEELREGLVRFRDECVKLALAQEFAEDTKVGRRQQWVKEQIAEKIRALPLPKGVNAAAHVLQTSKERDRAVVERQEMLWKFQELKADFDRVQAWACEVIGAVQASVKDDVLPAIASMQAKNMALETQLLVAREKWDTTFPNDGVKRAVLPYRELDGFRHGKDVAEKKLRELSFTALAVAVTDPATKEHKDAVNGLEFELHQAGYM